MPEIMGNIFSNLDLACLSFVAKFFDPSSTLLSNYLHLTEDNEATLACNHEIVCFLPHLKWCAGCCLSYPFWYNFLHLLRDTIKFFFSKYVKDRFISFFGNILKMGVTIYFFSSYAAFTVFVKNF